MRTRDILFSIYKKGNHPELSKIYSYGIFPKGLKNYFEIAVVTIRIRATEVLLYLHEMPV